MSELVSRDETGRMEAVFRRNLWNEVKVMTSFRGVFGKSSTYGNQRLVRLAEEQEIDGLHMLRNERRFGVLVIGFDAAHLLGKMALTVTLHFRLILVDTVQFGNFLLVDLPFDEENGLYGTLDQERRNNQQKNPSSHSSKNTELFPTLRTTIQFIIRTDGMYSCSFLYLLFKEQIGVFTGVCKQFVELLELFSNFGKTRYGMGKQDIVSTLQQLVSGIDESIVMFDDSGLILHASEGLKSLFDVYDLENRSIFEFLEGKAEGVKMWLENLRHSHFKDVRIKMLRNGMPFPARLRMIAWCTEHDRFVVLASVVDGTFIERRKRDLLRKTLTIEQLSKSRKIRNGKLHEAIYEILEMSSKAVQVERVNAWMFNDDATLIECIGNFDTSVPGLVPQESLARIEMPNYFRLFETEKIILSSRSQESGITRELLDSYLIPNNIQAMMDIPLRIEGEIIGVICFEQTSHTRDWSLQDQKFGLIAAQMVSLAVETHKRKLMQQELESALRQQQRMMIETNHRIKNNLSITASLMRMQLDKCKDDFHRGLIQDAINRINSIAALHELLAESNVSHRIRFAPYAKQLIEGLRESFSDPEKPIQLLYTIEDCEIASSLAITLGLIINETVTNSYKHAFQDQSLGMIRVNLTLSGPNGKLVISDTGKGFSPTMHHGQGFEIIEGLANHIDATLTTSSEAGSMVTIDFRLR